MSIRGNPPIRHKLIKPASCNPAIPSLPNAPEQTETQSPASNQLEQGTQCTSTSGWRVSAALPRLHRAFVNAYQRTQFAMR